MTVEENKAVMRRWISALNSGDELDIEMMVGLVDEAYSPEYTDDSPAFAGLQGREGLKTMLRDQARDIAVLRMKVEAMIGEGDTVSARITQTVTLRSTGRTFHQKLMSWHRFVDGKIQQEWALFDLPEQ